MTRRYARALEIQAALEGGLAAKADRARRVLQIVEGGGEPMPRQPKPKPAQPPRIDPDALLTVADLQRVLGCSRSSVYGMMKDGLRWSSTPGGRVVRGGDLQDWLRSRRKRG